MTTMTYKAVIASEFGAPDVLKVIENRLRPPAKGEVRIKVLAVSVCRPDITVRQGTSLYNGTPLGQKIPFVPGYAVIGDVDAVGADVTGVTVGDRVGALTVIGGYTEYLYWRGDRIIPVPATIDPAEGVTLILNYIVAYQCLHRSLKVQAGNSMLIIGASGGIGTALLQLGRLAGLTMYGLASKAKHHILTQYGAIPIDYHTEDYQAIIQKAEPAGLDYVVDGMMRLDYLKGCLALLKRGGKIVSYGEPAGLGELLRILVLLARVNLLPNGKGIRLYGTSNSMSFNKKQLWADWATLFKLLEEHRIEPIIMQKFPLTEAAEANKLLESGEVIGNLVLVTPDLHHV